MKSDFGRIPDLIRFFSPVCPIVIAGYEENVLEDSPEMVVVVAAVILAALISCVEHVGEAMCGRENDSRSDQNSAAKMVNAAFCVCFFEAAYRITLLFLSFFI